MRGAEAIGAGFMEIFAVGILEVKLCALLGQLVALASLMAFFVV